MELQMSDKHRSGRGWKSLCFQTICHETFAIWNDLKLRYSKYCYVLFANLEYTHVVEEWYNINTYYITYEVQKEKA